MTRLLNYPGRGTLDNSIESRQHISIGVGGGVFFSFFIFMPDGISRMFHCVVRDYYWVLIERPFGSSNTRRPTAGRINSAGWVKEVRHRKESKLTNDSSPSAYSSEYLYL